MAKAIWWFYFSKCLEFFDTVRRGRQAPRVLRPYRASFSKEDCGLTPLPLQFFFVLRKRDRQISFLHLYHHSTMFPLWWMGTRWAPGGSSSIPAAVNSSVHVVMCVAKGCGLSRCLAPRLTPFYLDDKRMEGKEGSITVLSSTPHAPLALTAPHVALPHPPLLPPPPPRYSYYMASALGKDSPLSFIRGLKRYITSLQLLQFFAMLVNTLVSLHEIRSGRCKFYAWMSYALAFYLLTMIALFGKFYRDTYLTARQAKADKKRAEQEAAADVSRTPGGTRYNLRRREPHSSQ